VDVRGEVFAEVAVRDWDEGEALRALLLRFLDVLFFGLLYRQSAYAHQ
jgi:hypothetical protein